MATATARSTLRDQLLDEVRGGQLPRLGWKLTLATITAGGATTTDRRAVTYFTDASVALNAWWLYVPSAAAADRVRIVRSGTVASGTATLTHDGPNTAPITVETTAYLLHPTVDPSWLNNLFDDVLTLERTDYVTLLSLPIADSDQVSSGVTDWTAGGGATLGKVTAAGNVPFSFNRALRVQNAAINEYAQSAAILPVTSTQYRAMGFARSAVGTAVLRV